MINPFANITKEQAIAAGIGFGLGSVTTFGVIKWSQHRQLKKMQDAFKGIGDIDVEKATRELKETAEKVSE